MYFFRCTFEKDEFRMAKYTLQGDEAKRMGQIRFKLNKTNGLTYKKVQNCVSFPRKLHYVQLKNLERLHFAKIVSKPKTDVL